MTNPNDMVRVRSRNSGRGSVYEANMWAQGLTDGVYSGNGVKENTSPNMTVLVGGTPNDPDVIIAQNPAGYKIALDIVETQPVTIAPPAQNSRITAIVAYTDDLALASTDTDTTGSPSSCGLIIVNGAASASPVAPTDSEIRAAITADGATGSQAAYGIIATFTIPTSTTTITNSLIKNNLAMISAQKIDFATYKYSTAETVVGTWIDGRPIYRQIFFGTITAGANQRGIGGFNVPNLDEMISVSGSWRAGDASNSTHSNWGAISADANGSNYYQRSGVSYRGGAGSDQKIEYYTITNTARTNAPFKIIAEYVKF